ncbi:PP2C family serine/threonine-protein phosphatase [Streptomyces roseolilacinus]|uniref:PP2C family serine/threonine-protein phosphatase n=1 Tax=Streptomyces roseolilacinus TaxID=66904 RepID=UPI003816EF4F
MSETHQLSACPGCSEPLESGDRFCGACGYDLSAVPEPPPDHPTVALTTPPPPAPPAPPATPVAAPMPPPAPAPAGPPAPTAPPPPPPPPAGPPAGAAPAGAPAPPHAPAPPAAPTAPETPAAPEIPAAPATPTPPEVPSVPAAPEPPVRHDDPHGDFEIAAPDPRVARRPAADNAPCVACRAGRVSADGYCENCGHKQPRERDHMEQERGRAVAAVSDRGLRHHRNEDAFAVSTASLPDGSTAVVAIVCDGVSSASRPDDASAAAARTADASLRAALPLGTDPRQAMHDAIVAASDAVNALADEPPGDGSGGLEHDAHRHRNAPACTLVGTVAAHGLLVVGWVGDSRAYWVPDDRATPASRLTEDDSWAAQMVAAGLMGEAEAYADERAHAITGWLGADAYELEPHTAVFRPDRPGVVVVCTDGLWNYAEAAGDMARVLPADAAEHPLHCARVLVGHALDGGGHDNVTVAVVPFAVPESGAVSA